MTRDILHGFSLLRVSLSVYIYIYIYIYIYDFCDAPEPEGPVDHLQPAETYVSHTLRPIT